MLNKVTKLPKSRFYVFGFGEKKQFTGRNATPNMGWLVELKLWNSMEFHRTKTRKISAKFQER